MRREISYVEEVAPPTRKPPIIETGAVGWLRQNLLSTWWNALLTVVSIVFIIWAITGFLTWAISQANWAVITNNLHLFALGTYAQAQGWRPLLSTLIIFFLIGLTWRLWGHAGRWVAIVTAVMLALLIALPLVAAGLPLPKTYVLVGGPSTDPLPGLTYLAEAEETVTFTLEPVVTFADAAPVGFVDRNSVTIYGLGRQETQGRMRLVNAELDALRGERDAALQTQANSAATATAVADDPEAEPVTIPAVADVTIPRVPEYPPEAIVVLDEESGELVIVERDLVATVTIWRVPYEHSTNEDGETVWTQGDPVEEATLTAGPEPSGEALTFTFPRTGWYVIEMQRAGETGAFWLELDAITPLETSDVLDTEREADFGPPPDLDGIREQLLDTTQIPFRGHATVQQWLKLYVGPMAEGLRDFTLVVVLATALGYALGWVLRRAGVGAADTAEDENGDDETPPAPQLGRRVALIGWVASPFVILILLQGFGDLNSALPFVAMELWGGLLLTMALTVVGIGVAFPIGVLLALGRRSELPIVRLFCTLSIEFVRGVPLVTILFAASILVPLVDPSLSNVDNVIRAMIGMTFFSAAYLAEIVRGGLQAVPQGQTEAAKAVGMSGWQITLLIVLPQALRAVIPAIMGQFVSLFKDTSLVIIIGLIDLLGIARSVINQPEYIGLQRETLVFISIIYFVISYVMSWLSRRLEHTGAGAVRRA